MRGHRDLRLVVAVTLACAVGALITPLGPVRVVFAAPLALILPGYALTAALFGSHRPDRLQWLPLTLGVSLACLALGSLLLNYAPGGIGGFVWTVLLVLIVLRSCVVAARRRGRPPRKPRSVPRPRPSPATGILSIGSLGIVMAALILTQTTVEADHVDGYTQLWVAPPNPTDVSARIGVTSEQQQSRAYRLEIEVGDRSSPMVRSFELEPSQTQTVTVRSGQRASPVRLEARLYLRGHPNAVYRRVSAWLPGREAR
jgi:Protein of unknown function (DUF1616)